MKHDLDSNVRYNLGPHRHFCTVLEEMRACFKTYNFGAMQGLMEELQSIGNRMESGLEAMDDYNTLREKMKAMARKYTALKREAKALSKEDDDD